MRVKLILNPAAGRVSPEKSWPTIQKLLTEFQLDYDLVKTTARGHATELARQAVVEKFDAVLAVGGDGTANEVVNGLLNSDLIFGLLPCGEGNDFGKVLGLPAGGIKEALTALAVGKTRQIDLGMVNGRAFLNMVGIGLDGEIAAFKEEKAKYSKGVLVYAFHLPQILLSFQPPDMEIEINGLISKEPIALIGIGNGRYEGGIFKLTPDAELDDGLLDVCIARYPGKIKTIWAALRAINGSHKDLSYVTMFKTDKVNIKADRPLAAHLDGEVFSSDKFEVRILPKKLRVLSSQ
jgi:YegS/Rv2252/BmrU family lipid kinase